MREQEAGADPAMTQVAGQKEPFRSQILDLNLNPVLPSAMSSGFPSVMGARGTLASGAFVKLQGSQTKWRAWDSWCFCLGNVLPRVVPGTRPHRRILSGLGDNVDSPAWAEESPLIPASRHWICQLLFILLHGLFMSPGFLIPKKHLFHLLPWKQEK